MAMTIMVCRVLGPVLLLRALSIVIDRKHFEEMARNVEREATTVSFSLFPIALLMACITLAFVHTDTTTPAAILIRVIAWGGIVKSSVLILLPRAVVAKVRSLERFGVLNIVLTTCFIVGAYFTWFGYFR